MTDTMLQLPIRPPIYPNTSSLPIGATAGTEAVVLSTPPTIYIYDGSSWVLVTNGGSSLVNSVSSVGLGLTASPTTGNVVLTLAQSILTSASPTFAGLTATGQIICSTFQMTTTPTAGYVLTTDGSGNGSWMPTGGGSGSVATITGTASQIFANGTSGSPESGAVTLTLPQSISTTNSPTFVGLNLSGLTINQAVVTDGAKNLISLAYSSLSVTSALVQRDVNQNTFANSFVSKAISIVSAAGITILTAASASWQNLTGTAIQTFQLPDATTLSVGARFYFSNNSTSILTVTNATPTSLFIIPTGGQGYVVLLVNGTAAGTWEYHFGIPSNSSWGTTSLITPGQVKCATFQMTTTPTNGYVLTSDGSGNASWSPTGGGSGSVSSITGTASQVLANGISGSPQTGAITLTLPQNIATTSSPQFASLALGYISAPPTNGLLVKSQSFFGETSATVSEFVGIIPTTSYRTSLYIGGSAQSSADALGIYLTTTLSVTGSATTPASFLINPNISNAGGGTIDYYSAIIVTGGTFAVTPTYSYSGYFQAPAAGSSGKIAVYTENLVVGNSRLNPPNLGALFTGDCYFGATSSFGSGGKVQSTRTGWNIVASDGTVTGGIYTNNGSTTGTQVLFASYSNHAIGFATNNNNAQMTLLTNGNVGINTNAPAAWLSIADSVNDTNNYGKCIQTIRPTTSSTHWAMVRSGNYVWGLGFLYNSNTFAIIRSPNTTDSSNTTPTFSIDTSGQVYVNNNNNGAAQTKLTNGSNGSSAYTALTLANDTGSTCNLFYNSSTRSTDGGTNTTTLRNDGGDLLLQRSSTSGIALSSNWLSTLSYYIFTSYTTTFKCGSSNSISYTIQYQRVGWAVTFNVPAISMSAAGSTTITSNTAIPSLYFPNADASFVCIVNQNGGWQAGLMRMQTNGIIQIWMTPGGSNFGSGTVGLPYNNNSFTYSIL